ncbi:hypothetical protein [Vagococcus acidifermentans]|uniref:Uncharacterized protein n=1 Tax=Vagococcus acidifermentans TaxID=564710 RepID=A0A430ALK8_9ENTE|nr:hypothetical protein [Vagococcus acidifermentans]RSU09002.1 hypothetical protein CBF27_13695 [Vagococcus acidifermentans]
MSKRTYYVKKTDTYHTYEFLEERQDDPKWREAFLAARRSRRLKLFFSFLLLIAVFLGTGYWFFYMQNDDSQNLSSSQESSGLAASQQAVVSSEQVVSSTSSADDESISQEASQRDSSQQDLNHFVVRQYTVDEQAVMTEEFLNWASGRAEIGGMAVNSDYFGHGASGIGDWYAPTADGPILVQQQHPDGRPGFDYYSIHALGGVIFYYSVYGTTGRTDEVNSQNGSLAEGFANVADNSKPIVKYMLCDNGVVYEMNSTGAYSDGFQVADDEGNFSSGSNGGNNFRVSEDNAAQQEWQRILSKYQ